MWSDLSDGELKERLRLKMTGVALPEDAINALVAKRDHPKWSEVIDSYLGDGS